MFRKLWPAFIWALLILVLISLPGSFIPKTQSPWSLVPYDKVIHAGLFFILSFLLMRGFLLQYKSSFLRSFYILNGIIIGIVFGLFTELWQEILNIGRFFNAYDFIADILGSIIAWPVFLKVKRKLK